MTDKPFKKGSYELARKLAAAHGYSLDDIRCHSKLGKLPKVRKEIIMALFNHGLHMSGIAHIVNRDPTTILYHVKPNLAKRFKNRLAAQKAYKNSKLKCQI